MAAHASSRVSDRITPVPTKPDGGRLRTGPEWAYEYKLNGYRACMQIVPDCTTVLTTRNWINFTHELVTCILQLRLTSYTKVIRQPIRVKPQRRSRKPAFYQVTQFPSGHISRKP